MGKSTVLLFTTYGIHDPPPPAHTPLMFSRQGSRIVMEGGVEPIEEGIEPGDLVFVLLETRHRTFRRLTEDSPHLAADVTVSHACIREFHSISERCLRPAGW